MAKVDYVRRLCSDAVAAGHSLRCSYDGEVDYEGRDVAKAVEALRACDEMKLTILSGSVPVGSALIIPGLEPDEEIADYSGAWIDKWWEENVR